MPTRAFDSKLIIRSIISHKSYKINHFPLYGGIHAHPWVSSQTIQYNKLKRQPHLTVNKNAIPFDANPPLNPSGIRLGTPALTTRGFREEQMREVADLIGMEARYSPRACNGG